MNGSVRFSNQKATQFKFYGRNTGTEDWTLLKEVTGLTYSIAGQKRKIYLANNTPYNQFKFENFGSGDSSACAWRIQSLDLFVSSFDYHNYYHIFIFQPLISRSLEPVL
ncbi:hypothetical protein WA171_001326 [Blastocystis sp. BT1]